MSKPLQRSSPLIWLSRAFETSRRREGLSFGHAALDVKQADRLLDMGTSRADDVYERIVLPGGGEVRRGRILKGGGGRRAV
jgi:hypothetical protein